MSDGRVWVSDGGREKSTPLQMRIEELRHHIRIESAVLEGAKNAMKLLQKTKSQDKNALREVSPQITVIKSSLPHL